MRQAVDSQRCRRQRRGAFGELRQHFADSPTPFGRVWFLVLAAVLVSCDAGDAPPAAVPFVPVGDVHDTMTWVIDPAADAVWGAAGFVLTEAGTEDLAPTTDADWALVQHSAAVVAASANLLLLPDALPEGDRTAWAEFATGMARIAQSAGQAAADRDAEALFQVGGQLYNVCVACHQVYDRPSA